MNRECSWEWDYETSLDLLYPRVAAAPFDPPNTLFLTGNRCQWWPAKDQVMCTGQFNRGGRVRKGSEVAQGVGSRREEGLNCRFSPDTWCQTCHTWIEWWYSSSLHFDPQGTLVYTLQEAWPSPCLDWVNCRATSELSSVCFLLSFNSTMIKIYDRGSLYCSAFKLHKLRGLQQCQQ